jgi:hypothetical protein
LAIIGRPSGRLFYWRRRWRQLKTSAEINSVGKFGNKGRLLPELPSDLSSSVTGLRLKMVKQLAILAKGTAAANFAKNSF